MLRVVRTRRAVTIGGGDSRAAVLHALSLTGREQPRVLWVGTAGAESAEAALRWFELLSGQARVSALRLFPWPPDDLRSTVLDQDAIVVGGGNTANMLALWRVHGVDVLLSEAWEAGVVLCGSSAGMICWFEAGVTDSFGPQLTGMRDGLGLLPGSACPHYDDEERRRPLYRRLIDEEAFPPGYAADAGVGLVFEGTELVEVVSPRYGATAFRVEPGSEVALPARRIG